MQFYKHLNPLNDTAKVESVNAAASLKDILNKIEKL